MNTKKNSRFIISLVASIAALAGLVFGFDTGIISGALLFIQQDFILTTEAKELIVSSVLVGAMIGSLCSGRLTDHFGRRRTMLLISVLFILGTLLASSAHSVASIILGRLCLGIAIGIGSYTAPLYIAETAPVELRGGLVSLNQLAITIGIMCSFCINYVFTNTPGTWRIMFMIGIIPAILLSIGMIFLPESPRWLMKKGEPEKARTTLRYLRRDENVATEFDEIKQSLNLRQATFFEVFSPHIRPVLFLGIMLGFLQQVTGINTIIYYAPSIFQLAGFHDTSNTILATVGIGIINVLATVFSIYYLDKVGRRPLLLAGLIGMGVSLLALSVAFHFSVEGILLQWIAMGCTFMYVICFAFSLGTMLCLMASEIFPLEVRGAAMGIAVFSSWFWNFVVSATFLSLLNAIGPSLTFSIYAIMCLVGYIFCYHKVPETNGISLEQIEKNIRKGLTLRWIGQPIKQPSLLLEKTSELSK